MRQIKFRVWNGLLMLSHSDMIIDECIELHDKQLMTVMQFTGLTDRNGKEIYEGDVLTDGGNENYNYVVEWVFAGFQLVSRLKPESGARGISDGINQGYFEDAEGLEVIGNIHEHPHLLTNPIKPTT